MPAVRRAQLLLLAMMTVAASCAHARAGEDAAARAADTHRGAAPSAVAPAGEQVRAAAAAVLVATLGQQFGDDMLEITLGEAGVEVVGPREHIVSGLGEVRFAGNDRDDDWLAFRYQTRYDPLFASAGWPEISLGAGGEGEGEHYVPNDAGLLVELEARVVAELEAEPGAGRVHLLLDEVSTLRSGSRFMHIEASGLADFGPGGSTGARVDALYDLHAGAWLAIRHELAPSYRMHDDGGTAGP